jgi:hypothetical protein
MILYSSMEMQIDTEGLITKATQNVQDMVTIALEHDSSHRALVVYDTENEMFFLKHFSLISMLFLKRKSLQNLTNFLRGTSLYLFNQPTSGLMNFVFVFSSFSEN